MALSAFDDRQRRPGAPELQQVLGRSRASWELLLDRLAAAHAPLEQTWTYSGSRWGWGLRLRHRRRTILHLTPQRGRFLAGFALGEKAVQAAHESRLPEHVLEQIDGAPRYAEGRAVRLEVRNQRDVAHVVKLAAVKMAT
jgi:hypothetical protein